MGISKLGLINGTVTTTRPLRAGPGGDTPAGDGSVLLDAVDCTFQPATRLVRDVDGREVVSTGSFWIDPHTEDGVLVDVQGGDYISWAAVDGRAGGPFEVILVEPWYCDGTADHLKVVVGAG